MKYFRTLSAILLLSFYSQNVLPQEPDKDSTSTHLLIEKGIALYDDGKYDEALGIFQRVSPSDPDYWWACYESALTLYTQNYTGPALAKVQEALQLNPEDVQSIILQGSLLDDTGNLEEAIRVLSGAADRWPWSQKLLYNLALCYVNQARPDLAEPLLLRSIRINPYHRSSHSLLGRVNFMMGRKGQSFLAYNMAILINPSVNYLTEFENAVTGRLDSLDRSYLYPYPPGTEHRSWDELTRLMNSGLAFSKDFDYPYAVNYLTARESLMLFRKLQFNPADTSLYSQFYVRFFTALQENMYIEPWLYFSYKNTTNPTVAEWMGKNKKSLQEFIDWATEQINSWRTYGFSTAKEAMKETTMQYDEDGNLTSIGQMKMQPTEIRTGPWINLGDGGFAEEKGAFQNGEQEGEWLVFYPGGAVKQRLFFHNGKLNGTNYQYYPNGAKSGVYPRVMGKREGAEEEYSPSGLITSREEFRDDLPDGRQLYNYYDKGFRSEKFFIMGIENGTFTETWLNGHRKTEVNVKEGLYEGTCRTWYATGVLESEGNFTAGLKTGKWTYFNALGIMTATEELNDQGEISGTKTEYYSDGNKQRVAAYENDTLEGTETTYYGNGAVRTRTEYQAGKPLRTECFNADGKSLYQASDKNGSITLKEFYPDGTLEMEGAVRDGKYSGLWKYYDPVGRPSREITYQEGYRTGPQKQFFDNGKLEMVFNCDSNYIIGPYREFFSCGRLKVNGNYCKSGPCGEWVTYYCNDSLETKGFYYDGNQAGRVFYFSPDGKKQREQTFNLQGKSVRQVEYDPWGRILLDRSYEYDSVRLETRYPDGTLRTGSGMVDNLEQGKSEVFYQNGKLFISNSFRYGKEDGVDRRWDYQGNPELELTYTIGNINGVVKHYESGKLVQADPYANGLNQGNFIDFHPNGRVASCIPYRNDKRHGDADFFAPDSSFMFRMVYYEDVLTGITWKNGNGEFLPETKITPSASSIVCYYPNGKVSARISLKNSLMDGLFQMYFPDGRLMKEKMMTAGYLEGTYRTFYPNGNPRETSMYHNNHEEGPYELRYENGKIFLQGQYTAGQIMGEWKTWDETGRLLGTTYFDNNMPYARPE